MHIRVTTCLLRSKSRCVPEILYPYSVTAHDKHFKCHLCATHAQLARGRLSFRRRREELLWKKTDGGWSKTNGWNFIHYKTENNSPKSIQQSVPVWRYHWKWKRRPFHGYPKRRGVNHGPQFRLIPAMFSYIHNENKNHCDKDKRIFNHGEKLSKA